MDSNLFNVIYTGKIIDDFDTETVVNEFSNKFKLPVAKAEKVVKSAKERILRPRIEHVKAYKLKSSLEAMGLEVRLERAVLEEAAVVVHEESHVAAVVASPEVTATVNSQSVGDLEQKASIKTPPIDTRRDDNCASWSLEPLLTEEPEVAAADDSNETPGERVLFTNKVEHVYQPEKKPELTEDESDETEEPDNGRVKVLAALGVGALVAVFLLLKLFGVF